MIQRIQSIWLLLAFIASLLLFFLPLSSISAEGSEFILKYRGVYKISGANPELFSYTIPLAIISFIIMISSLSNIFLFKNRILQMRICVFSLILVFSAIGLLVYSSYLTFDQEQVSHASGSVLPLLIAIFTFLARRSINKDEKLVKSTDRIR